MHDAAAVRVRQPRRDLRRNVRHDAEVPEIVVVRRERLRRQRHCAGANGVQEGAAAAGLHFGVGRLPEEASVERVAQGAEHAVLL